MLRSRGQVVVVEFGAANAEPRGALGNHNSASYNLVQNIVPALEVTCYAPDDGLDKCSTFRR